MRKSKTPTPVTTAVLTLITIFFWVGFEVFRALTVKPNPPVPQAILRPLNPTLDTQSLNDISTRSYLDDTEIGNIQAGSTTTASSSPSPSPLATSRPTSTASAIPQSTSSATVLP